MAQELSGESPIELGGQIVSGESGGAFTGQISARLVADAGGRWAQLGHWERRRQMGETDDTVNRQAHQALRSGLNLILLVGEPRGVAALGVADAIDLQLSRILDGCTLEQVKRMVLVYEPEWTIGVAQPAPAEHVAAGCGTIREWLTSAYGPETAQSVRLAYGGSVSPAFAAELLTLPDLDGLGAGRKGRDPQAFAEIVSLIAHARIPQAAGTQ
jgi:triosephosphate isomerase